MTYLFGKRFNLVDLTSCSFATGFTAEGYYATAIAVWVGGFVLSILGEGILREPR